MDNLLHKWMTGTYENWEVLKEMDFVSNEGYASTPPSSMQNFPNPEENWDIEATNLPFEATSKENVVGPVYKIKCEECNAVYVGEMERSLKARFSEHRRPSSTTSEISKHIHVDHPQHSVELENTEVVTTETRWFERGVKGAIYIRALNPSFNRDGGRYNLPLVWDNIIKKRVKADRPRRGGGGPRHHHLEQRPREHHRDVLTDEADSRRRKLL